MPTLDYNYTDMKLSLYKSFPDDLESEWNALLAETASHVPFLRHDYQHIWWQTRGGGEWSDAELAIVTGRQNGQLVSIAPLFFTPDHQGTPALLLLGSIEISDYLDMIARPDDLPSFLKKLLPFLASANLPHWRVLDLYNILDNSPTLSALKLTADQLGWTTKIEKLQHCPYIPLPTDWDTYLAGIDKKQRHEIRRKIRRFEQSDVPGRWYIVQDAEVLNDEIEAFLALMEQESDKADFLTTPMRDFMHQTIRCAFEANCLTLAFLEIDGQKAAAKLCFDYLNRLWAYNSGIDRRFLRYSPGWVLLGYLLRWAIERGREEYDFMRGSEKYKYRFGAIDHFVVRATLSPPDDHLLLT